MTSASEVMRVTPGCTHVIRNPGVLAWRVNKSDPQWFLDVPEWVRDAVLTGKLNVRPTMRVTGGDSSPAVAFVPADNSPFDSALRCEARVGDYLVQWPVTGEVHTYDEALFLTLFEALPGDEQNAAWPYPVPSRGDLDIINAAGGATDVGDSLETKPTPVSGTRFA